MKTRFLIIAFLCAFIGMEKVHAQSHSSNCYYVEIYEVSILGAKSVNLDFGKDAPGAKVYKIFDENEQNIEFKNVIAALNYMSSRGWEVVTVVDKNAGKSGNKISYLLKLDTTKHPKDHIVKAIEEALSEF